MNGYLVIGGPCDGRRITVDYEPHHGQRISLTAPSEPMSGHYDVVGEMQVKTSHQEYRFWEWLQGHDGRRRIYVIPHDWDGFEAMDYIERRLYAD